MALPFFDIGSLDLPTLDPGGFSVAPDLGGLDLSGVGGLTGGGGSPTGGGGGFSFPSLGDLGKGIGIGTDLLKAGGGIFSAVQNANYQKSLSDYYSQRSKAEAVYNQQVQDYLAQRAQFESGLLGQFGEQSQTLQDALLAFQGQVSDVFNQEMAAAQPLLRQGQKLSSEGVAALTKGQVPAEWEPVFSQARQRAQAAAMQRAVSAGIDPQTAAAQSEAQIEQDQRAMLLQMASGVIGQGESLSRTGLGFEQAATGAAVAGIDPVLREFLAVQQLLGGLLGGFPGLASAQGAPPPPGA